MYKSWEPMILGVLAEEGSIPDRQSIFINKTNELQFSIQIISTTPSSFPNSRHVITCWGSDLESHGFEDDSFDRKERIQNLIHFLDRKLLVFQVEKKANAKEDYFTAKNIHLIAKKPSFTPKLAYHPIPLYIENEEKVNPNDYNWAQFSTNLAKGQYIGRNERVSQEPEDTPRYLLYKTLSQQYIAAGAFENHHYAHGGFSFMTGESEFKYFTVQKELLKEIYIWDHVAFIEHHEDHEILTQLQSGQSQSISNISAEQHPEETLEIVEESTQLPVEEKATNPLVNEEAFMQQFIDETKKMQLLYKKEDLYNFHTCMKAGSLTILAGMSGTGKSQLINAYRKALHLDADKFLMVPVSPTWTDDSDVLGYPDIVNSVYRAADSGIVNLLIEAAENPTETFIICFDEMNLAKVEHYFSQFLSVLEMEKGRRKLRLYNEDLQNKFYNGSRYPHEIFIGENVIFTGTVNLDESTHHFSDKVLDRANLMTLHVEPFEQLLQLAKASVDKTEMKQKISYTVQEFVKQDRKMALNENELAFLWEVHKALTEISINLGIGPRVVRQIDHYIKNLSDLKDCPIDRKRAFDLQFSQRILSKIRGSEEMLQKLIGIYDEEKQTVHHSRLIELFDAYTAHSNFEQSRALISEKAKELVRSGYAF